MFRHSMCSYICHFGLLAGALLATADARDLPPARQSFDAGWRFHLGDIAGAQGPNVVDGDWRILDLPHDWSAEADFTPNGASATGFLPGGIGWYRKTFTLPASLHGRQVTLAFDGVYRDSDVWCNGMHLGHRPSGYVGFRYDLTPYLRLDGSPNVVAVRVDRSNVADSRWYPGTGIYRHVWLEHAPLVQVAPDGVFVVTPRITAAQASVTTTTDVANLSSEPRTLRVTSRVLDATGREVSRTYTEHHLAAGQRFSFSDWQQVPQPHLWSPASPNLYTLETQLTEGDTVWHVVDTTFGIREARFDAQAGFFLNGQALKLKGVCLHHDGGVVGAAVPDALLERRLRQLQELGVNAIRCSHNSMAPELYALCDRLGLLVMDEAFDEWELGKRKWVAGRNRGKAERFGYSAAFAEWGERDLADQVKMHRNHPSIILWSIGNEIDYPTDPYVHPESRIDRDFANFDPRDHPSVTRLNVIAPALIATVKRLDPTRPVTMALANIPAANGTGLAKLLDVVGYNYQEADYAADHAQFPERIIYGSENAKTPEAWAFVRDTKNVSAQFLWTGFDFLGEAGMWPQHGSGAGLFDTAGHLKPVGMQFAALWSEKPVLHLVVHEGRRTAAHWNWADVTAPLTITAYSNCPEVELFLNGTSLGAARPGPDRRVEWPATFKAGELVAIGRDGGRECARALLRTANAPARLSASLDRTHAESASGLFAIDVSVVDAAGTRVPDSRLMISAGVSGAGRLLGVDSGDLQDPSPLHAAQRRANAGRVLVLVAATSNGSTPPLLHLTAPGLPALDLPLAYSSP